MDRLRIANRGPAWRILIAVCGIALVVGAAVLIVRPLTALTGLVITLSAALVLAGVKVVGSRPRQPWRWIWAVLLVGVAPVLLLLLPSVVRALPGAVAISLGDRRYHRIDPPDRRHRLSGRLLHLARRYLSHARPRAASGQLFG